MNLGYRMLRIANERFGAMPSELSSEQQQEAERIARYEQDIEFHVLSSPEAQMVIVPETETQAALDQIRGRYEDAAAYDAALEAQGLDEDDLLQALERELRVEAVMELVASRGVTVSATEARMYYYLHQDQFMQPERREVRQILITVNDDLEENNAEIAAKRCLDISERLQKHPKWFAEQALKHSECPSSLNGGLLGKVPKGVLFPELDTVLFDMQPGSISNPIYTELGWHILMCESVEPEDMMSLERVLPDLQEKMQQRQNKKTQRSWLSSILKSAEKEAAVKEKLI